MNTNLAKLVYFNFHPKTLWFFFLELFFQFPFFSRTPEILHLHFFSLSTLWKFFFGHLDFVSHKTLRHFFFLSNTPTLDIFFDFRKKLSECSSANNRKVLVKYRMWLTSQLYHKSKITQSNIIEFIVTRHTHTHILFWSKEIWAANSEFNRVSRENSA